MSVEDKPNFLQLRNLALSTEHVVGTQAEACPWGYRNFSVASGGSFSCVLRELTWYGLAGLHNVPLLWPLSQICSTVKTAGGSVLGRLCCLSAPYLERDRGWPFWRHTCGSNCINWPHQGVLLAAWFSSAVWWTPSRHPQCLFLPVHVVIWCHAFRMPTSWSFVHWRGEEGNIWPTVVHWVLCRGVWDAMGFFGSR